MPSNTGPHGGGNKDALVHQAALSKRRQGISKELAGMRRELSTSRPLLEEGLRLSRVVLADRKAELAECKLKLGLFSARSDAAADVAHDEAIVGTFKSRLGDFDLPGDGEKQAMAKVLVTLAKQDTNAQALGEEVFQIATSVLFSERSYIENLLKIAETTLASSQARLAESKSYVSELVQEAIRGMLEAQQLKLRKLKRVAVPALAFASFLTAGFGISQDKPERYLIVSAVCAAAIFSLNSLRNWLFPLTVSSTREGRVEDYLQSSLKAQARQLTAQKRDDEVAVREARYALLGE